MEVAAWKRPLTVLLHIVWNLGGGISEACMMSAFRKLLLVIKHSAYESYLQMKSQGKAPLALRWERLRHRHQVHKECVSDITDLLTRMDVDFSCIGREELDRQHLKGADLVVAVGGDGTVLSCSHFLDDRIPLVGVNSDPTRDDEHQVKKKTDERRSTGALCACTASNMYDTLPRILAGEVEPCKRTRIQTVIRSTLLETKLAVSKEDSLSTLQLCVELKRHLYGQPSLNDILIAHPIPAAVSRFRIGFVKTSGEETFSFNVWSSGLWVCSATGSTAVMSAAGGTPMDLSSDQIQFKVREHLTERGFEHLQTAGHGLLDPGQSIHLRWNSQQGCIFVDGSHLFHDIQLGDEVYLSAAAPPVLLYERPRIVTEKDHSDVRAMAAS